MSKSFSPREWTRNEALKKISRTGIKIQDRMIEVKRGVAGNRTLGALDYLDKEHNYIIVFKD